MRMSKRVKGSSDIAWAIQIVVLKCTLESCPLGIWFEKCHITIAIIDKVKSNIDEKNNAYE